MYARSGVISAVKSEFSLYFFNAGLQIMDADQWQRAACHHAWPTLGTETEPCCGLDQRYTASSNCTLDTSATLASEGITGQTSSARGEPLGLLADELPSWRMLTS